MNFPNSTQSRIASFRGQHAVFLLPDSDVPDEQGVRHISIAPAKIRLFFEALRDVGH
jgi:hypothetical protein